MNKEEERNPEEKIADRHSRANAQDDRSSFNNISATSFKKERVRIEEDTEDEILINTEMLKEECHENQNKNKMELTEEKRNEKICTKKKCNTKKKQSKSTKK